jgi:hypothetical protein
MRKKSVKIFLYIALGLVVLFALAFVMVYQEFGPVDQDKLVIQKVRQGDLVADFFYPEDSKPLPLVIALGCSGGGFLPEKEMQALALQGCAVLSVAYFNAEWLPKKLESIPLEYIGHIIN